MTNQPSHLAGSYGTIAIHVDTSMAVKTTSLYSQVYEDDDEVYVMACNLREICFMKKLQQNPLENVIRCYGVHVSNAGKLVSRMELACGNLCDFIKSNSYDGRMRYFDKIFQQVSIGLVNMHRSRVVHGDVKSLNIVMVSTSPLVIRLVDFGGLSWVQNSFRHNSLCTYVVRSPELFEDGQQPSFKADAWSLGATMLQYITKAWIIDDCPPKDIDIVDHVREQIKNGLTIWIPPTIPKRMQVMLAGLLDVNPNTRWSVEDALYRYFKFFEPSFPRPRRAPAPKLPVIRDTSYYSDIVRLVYTMVSARNETIVAPYVINYIQRFFQNDFDKVDVEIQDAILAAYALARAIVLDKDTPVSLLSDSVQSCIISMLRKLEFDLLTVHPSVPRVISIDGNIAASKSTVIAALNAAGIPAVGEPVEEWEPLLKLFYEDQSRWATALHVKILSTYAEMYQKYASTGQVLVCERSPWSCLHVFQSMLRADDIVGQQEHDAVMKLGSLIGMPDVIIYLRTEPDVCVERQVKRRRTCEEGLSREYICRLHAQYEHVMDEAHCHQNGIIMVPVDANRLIEEVCADVIDKVKRFM